MLRQRLITASALGPLVLAAVWFMPNYMLALGTGVIVLVSALELNKLAQLNNPLWQTGYLLGLVLGMLTLYHYSTPNITHSIQAIATLGWLIATIGLILTRRNVQTLENACHWIPLIGSLVLMIAWLSIVQLHQNHPHGPALVVFLLILTWVADSSAYFVGKYWGRKPLSPTISPGKTWAGVFGAIAGASLCAVWLWRSGWLEIGFVYCLALCLIVTLLSIGGDLSESFIKRLGNHKDSGALLPGHGGLLDRIDSTLASAPVFALGVNSLELQL